MISESPTRDQDLVWFDIMNPQQEDFYTLSDKFNIPPLLMQDTLKPEHLPKYELSENGHFLMMRSFDIYSEADATTIQELTRKIALFITPTCLVSIHRVKFEYLEEIKKLSSNFGGESLVYQIIISVIRSYEHPILKLQEMFDEFEEEILAKKMETLDTEKIYQFRRKLFVIKRILNKTQDALYRSKNFWIETPSRLQDLKENIDQIYFQVDDISDNFEHLFQIHISLNDQKANEIMKILTVFSTVLLPLNFMASFYGMNFEFLPGLHSPHAFGLLTIIMLAIALTGIIYFVKKGWFRRGE